MHRDGRTLSDYLSFRSGKVPPPRAEDGDYTVFGSNGAIGRAGKANVSGPAVIIGRVGSYCGSLRFAPYDAWVTDNAIACSPRDSLEDTRFWYYALSTLSLNERSSGSGQPLLNQSVLGAIPFEAPGPDKQRAIAEVLGALDDKIAANTRLAQSHAELAQQLFESAASTAPLTRVSLGDLVSTQYGLTASSSSGDGPRLLRVTDINKKPWIEWEGAPGCTPSDAELAQYGTEPGDILVARMADPGKAAFIDAGDPVAVFASYLVRLKTRDPKVGLFIYYFLRSAAYHSYVESAMTGSVQRNMNARAIVGTAISVPSEDLLRQFNSRVGSLRGSLQAVLVENRTLAATRDALLPALMSGKLRVRDAERIVEDAV